MKRVLALLLLCCGTSFGASISRVQVVCSTFSSVFGQALSTTTISATNAGDFILSMEETDVDITGTPYPSNPTDDTGNTYSSVKTYGGTGFNPSQGNHGQSASYNYTVDAHGGVTQVRVPNVFGGMKCVLVYRSTNGFPASPIDSNNNTHNGATTAYNSGNTATLAQASELAIGTVSNKNAGTAATFTSAAAFSDLYTSAEFNGDFALKYAENIVSATTALAYSGTGNPSADYETTIFTVKDNAAAAASSGFNKIMRLERMDQ